MKLMLVDDHALFMEGLRYLLEIYGFEIVCTAGSGKEALEQAELCRPDVILMDIRMPGLNGFDTLNLLKARRPDVKVVMLTASQEDEDLFQAIKYGASGYLLKSTNAAELVETLREIERGESSLSSVLASRLLNEFNSAPGTDITKGENAESYPQLTEKPQLTERQLKILELVAQGVSYREVGEILGLTERTIKYHMGNIVEILHVNNRSQVIAYAAKTGIIQDK
jgi:two-component system NarL family response regulator